MDPEQFEIACAYLEALGRPLRGFNTRFGSYGFKHLAEQWAGEYVSNGAFIAAALALGFRFRQDAGDGLNCTFNLQARRRERSIGAALRAGKLDRRTLTTLAHHVADRLAVPFWLLSRSLEPAIREFPDDAVGLAARLDTELKMEPGTCLAAFGHVIHREVAR